MKYLKLIAALIILAVLACPLTGAKLTKSGQSNADDDDSTGSSHKNDVEDENEETDFPDADERNIYSDVDVKKFTNKLFVNGADIFGKLPTSGEIYKVLSMNGWLDDDGEVIEEGWNQFEAAFWDSDDCFETDADREAYLQEIEDFSDGIPNSLPIHAKQVTRFLQFVAGSEGVDLSENAQLTIPRGIVYWENEGTIYPIPVFGEITYKKDQPGKIKYPSLDSNSAYGFKDDLASVPYEIDKTADSIGWYSQKSED